MTAPPDDGPDVYHRWRGVHVDHYGVREKGAEVTVRIGKDGIFACLSGRCWPATECKHVEKVERFVQNGGGPRND